MSERLQSIFLVGLAGLFLFVITGWGTFKRTFGLNNSKYAAARQQYDRLKRINIGYRVILVAFIILSVIYFYFPLGQKLLIPIQWLNNDYVNITGIVILVFAFVLVLFHQLKLDKNLPHYYLDPEEQNTGRLVPQTEQNLLKSILLVYVGLFTVVSTVATAILLVTAFIIYYFRSANRQYRIPTSLKN